MSKICCTCRTEQLLSNFCKNKNALDNLSAQCKDCAKKYREEHKDNKKNYPSSSTEYKIKYQSDPENKKRFNESARKRRARDPEKYRKQSLASYFRNRAKRLEHNHIYYTKNKDIFKAKNKEFRVKNIDSILLRNRMRQKLLNVSNITQLEIDNLLALHNHQCFYCKVSVMRKVNLHLDHKTPLSRNGAHTIDNLAPACATCNLRKGTKTVEEFLETLNRNY